MAPIREIMMDDLEEEEDVEQELRVTFYPELHLQRRIWVLNILRRENTTRVHARSPESITEPLLIRLNYRHWT